MDHQFIFVKPLFSTGLRDIHAEQNTLIDCTATCSYKYGIVGKNGHLQQ